MQATVTSKAQITLPKGLRQLMGLKAGDKLEFTALPDGSARLARAGSLSFKALQGIIPRPTRSLTVEEMDQSVAQHLAESDQRVLQQKAAPKPPANATSTSSMRRK